MACGKCGSKSSGVARVARTVTAKQTSAQKKQPVIVNRRRNGVRPARDVDNHRG